MRRCNRVRPNTSVVLQPIQYIRHAAANVVHLPARRTRPLLSPLHQGYNSNTRTPPFALHSTVSTCIFVGVWRRHHCIHKPIHLPHQTAAQPLVQLLERLFPFSS